MKRYTIRADSASSSTGANIFESSTGYWVSHSDHEAAIKAAVATERDATRVPLDIANDAINTAVADAVEKLRADLAAAQAEVERLTQQVAGNAELIGKFVKAAAEAEAEAAALRVDAERYRWLRKKSTHSVPMCRVFVMVQGSYFHRIGVDIDAAIDAARKEGV